MASTVNVSNDIGLRAMPGRPVSARSWNRLVDGLFNRSPHVAPPFQTRPAPAPGKSARLIVARARILDFEEPDKLRCELASTSEEIIVARNLEVRQVESEGDVTYTEYSDDATERVAEASIGGELRREHQIVFPLYRADQFILASKGIDGGTGIDDVDWLETTPRVWMAVPFATCEVLTL